MTVPGVSCKALATQNSSEWLCSICPFPVLRLVGVRTSYIFFLIFPEHLELGTPLQIPSYGPPLGYTLLQFQEVALGHPEQRLRGEVGGCTLTLGSSRAQATRGSGHRARRRTG